MEQNKKREIDKLAESSYKWLNESYVYIKEKKIKTWHGLIITALLAGIAMAIFWSIVIKVKTSSVQVNNSYESSAEKSGKQ